jgi:hypothetical protein
VTADVLRRYVTVLRIKPHRHIVSTSREAEEHIVTVGGVPIWIASSRVGFTVSAVGESPK